MSKKSTKRKLYVRQMWAGFGEGRLDVREIDTGFGGWGSTGFVQAPSIFKSRREAFEQYVDVRRVEIRELP